MGAEAQFWFGFWVAAGGLLGFITMGAIVSAVALACFWWVLPWKRLEDRGEGLPGGGRYPAYPDFNRPLAPPRFPQDKGGGPTPVDKG